MKKRDKKKRRERKLERANDRAKARAAEAIDDDLKENPVTVKVIKDTRGKQYIKAPDGSLRRADKTEPEKLDWLAEA